MATVIHVSQKPTFDLTQIEIKSFDPANRLCYFESKQVFKFDQVYGNLENRSRLIRLNRDESLIAEQVISATIDAGYCGHLVWKMKLTEAGAQMLDHCDDLQKCAERFVNCQQIHLFFSPAGNYYNGTNQTTLEPDIIFTSQ